MFGQHASALAAMAKGYSRAIDSARIVHALHAWNVGAGVATWFEYVNTKANISDMPSRNEFTLLRAMGSIEVAVVLPQIDDWFQPAAAWLERAAGTRSSAATGRRRKRRRDGEE